MDRSGYRTVVRGYSIRRVFPCNPRILTAPSSDPNFLALRLAVVLVLYEYFFKGAYLAHSSGQTICGEIAADCGARGKKGVLYEYRTVSIQGTRDLHIRVVLE